MEAVAAYLLEHETMSGEDFAAVMGFAKVKGGPLCGPLGFKRIKKP